jgi:hypothetical protein
MKAQTGRSHPAAGFIPKACPENVRGCSLTFYRAVGPPSGTKAETPAEVGTCARRRAFGEASEAAGRLRREAGFRANSTETRVQKVCLSQFPERRPISPTGLTRPTTRRFQSFPLVSDVLTTTTNCISDRLLLGSSLSNVENTTPHHALAPSPKPAIGNPHSAIKKARLPAYSHLFPHKFPLPIGGIR